MGNENRTTTQILLDKAVNIEPMAAMYRFDMRRVEEFVERYLIDKGVSGVKAVASVAKSKGSRNPMFSIIILLDPNSNMIDGKTNIPENLQNKVDNVSIKLKDEFKRILFAMAGDNFKFGRYNSNISYVEITKPFRVLGMMFMVKPGETTINLTELSQTDSATIITVTKAFVYPTGNKNKGDSNYSRIINDLASRDND